MSAPATPTTINYGVRLTPARMNVVTAALLLGACANRLYPAAAFARCGRTACPHC